MCEGVALPHSAQTFSLAERQRCPLRRRRFFIFEVLRFGTAMVKKKVKLFEVGRTYAANF